MEIKPLASNYAVSPQPEPSDMQTIADAGYGTVICNRPDVEIPPSFHSAVMEQAAEAAGMSFVDNPITHQGLNLDMVALQAETIAGATKPVFAYCASGTRSTIVWALSQAGRMSTDDILGAAAAQGYDIGGMRGQLDALAAQGGVNIRPD